MAICSVGIPPTAPFPYAGINMFTFLFAQIALAQDYRFPAGDEHYGYFYPTAYVDEGGADWNCGGIFYSGHQGSDFGAGSWAGMDEGRRVVAAADGVVVATNDGEYDRCSTGDCGDANYVIIEHANGRRTWYWHLKQWSVAVSPGQSVSCGTHLGYVGSSGNSTGPHVHFEVREPNGAMGDPFDGPCSAPPTYWISQGDYGGLPGGSCPNAGPCNQVQTLSCGQTINTANNAGGATQSHGTYGCGSSTSSGPEIAFAFSTPINESVTMAVTGLGADLDFFVLASNQCDGSGAITCSTNPDSNEEWVAFDASAGAVYTLVVDGWEGATSGFNISAFCDGGQTPVDTSPPEDSTPTDSQPDTDRETRLDTGSDAILPGQKMPLQQLGCCTDDSSSSTDTTNVLPGEAVPLDKRGCGGAGATFLMITSLGLRRRQKN